MSQKMHYHMICGEIIFKDASSEIPSAVRCNGVLVDPEKNIPVRLLGKAQQILQLQFHQKMDGLVVTVVDVVLMNFMYLGFMTEEQFRKTPEGMKVQEKPPVADLETAVGQALRGVPTSPAIESAANADTNEA